LQAKPDATQRSCHRWPSAPDTSATPGALCRRAVLHGVYSFAYLVFKVADERIQLALKLARLGALFLRAFGFQAEVGFRDGLKRTIDWFRTQRAPSRMA